jgi:large subunit ribosomal protein L7/L12
MAVSKDEVLDAIAKMSVIEVVELIADMEKKFGVTAAAPVALAAGPAAGGAAAAPVEEQTEFTVTLKEYPADKKVTVIKVIREITGLGQGPGRGRPLDGQGIHLQGRRRSNQEKTRRRWREGGGQITSMVRLGTRGVMLRDASSAYRARERCRHLPGASLRARVPVLRGRHDALLIY